MALFNCKAVFLSVTGNENNINNNDNANDIIFTIKDTKLYVPFVTLSTTDNQKLSKFLYKGFEDQFIGRNIKQRSENTNTTNGYRYFF